mgnify:CR=1 FL=1
MQLTQSLRRAAQLFPGRTSTVFGKRRRTWAETADRVARMAGGIAALGVQPGERVMILASNSDRYLESVYALFWAGCVVVPGNTRWAASEHAYAWNDCQPSLLLVDQDFVDLARGLPRFDASRTVFIGDAPPADLVGFESLVNSCGPLPDRAGQGHDMAAIMYTGGTTGAAKGVMLSHDNLALAPVTFALECTYEEDVVFMHVAPMFHLAAMSSMLSYTSAGATQVILARFDPAMVVSCIAAEKVNMTLLVPTMIDFVDRYLQAVPTDVSSLRKLIYGGSPISEALLRRAMKSLPGVQLFQAYGQTEMSGGVVVLRPEFHVVEGSNARLLCSAGRPTLAAELRIVNEQMQEVPRGTVGEIVVRGSTVMLGYWNKPDQTRAAIVDGWLRSGDAGYMDEEGFIFVVDRLKDMIVSGGENVYSAEVENALARHPAVLECAVIGVPHEQWGEAVHAEIRLREGQEVDEETLVQHCLSLISGYKRPRSFYFRTDPLPLSAAGKVMKNEIRKPYWKGQNRRIA